MKKRIPALLNEKDLSADFLEYIADDGNIVWRKNYLGNKNQFGLFFYQESPASVKYNKESNYVELSFTKDIIRNDCFNLFYNEFEPELAKQGIEITLDNTSALVLHFSFWWK